MLRELDTAPLPPVPAARTREDLLAFASLPSLKELAEKLHLSPPTVLARLRIMSDEGMVQRIETPAGPRHVPLPFLHVYWHDPAHGYQEQWKTSTATDWRFPLVSRVPDAPAQSFLIEWLDRAQARGLLPAMISRFEQAPRDTPRLRIVVYGSCARGDARDKSDLDVLLLTESPWDGADGLIDLAHEVGLRADRMPDLRALTVADLDDALPGFRDHVHEEAKTVWSNDPLTPLVEQAGGLGAS